MRTASQSAPATARPDIDLTDLFVPVPGPQVVIAAYGPDGVGILLVGDGPRTCTSVRTLVRRRPRPQEVYDVNGYYAELGVDPGADRRALTDAYLARDGQNSARLTEILMILKDPRGRIDYDRMHPAQRYADSQIIDRVRRARARTRIRVNLPVGTTGNTEGVYSLTQNTQKTSPEYTPSELGDAPTWGYSHYLWGAMPGPLAHRYMPEWQQMIIAALDDEASAPPMRFAVGCGAAGKPATALAVADTPTAFLPHGCAPTAAAARSAARQLRQLAQEANATTR